jgi:hypothetical protein
MPDTRPCRSASQRRLRLLGGLLLLLTLVAAPSAAQAQYFDPPGSARRVDVGRLLLSFALSNGGYFLTSSSGRDALGDALFYNPILLYGRPKRLNEFLTIAGGMEITGMTNNYFGFTGNSGIGLFGPSARLSVPPEKYTVRPYIALGLYYGSIQSSKYGFTRSDFTPGMEFGVDWKIGRYVTLTASYRIQETIAGVNTDGFGLGIRIF